MAIKETEIVGGEIYFKTGNYKKKVNIKTTGATAFTGEIIDLKSYTEGEEWESPSIQYGITAINMSESINQISVNIEYLSDDKNIFKFVGSVNGKETKNEIQVSWFAREEIIDIGGEIINSTESQSMYQQFNHTLSVIPYKFLGATVNTGTLSYTLPDATNTMTFTCNNGNPYKQYAKFISKEEIGKPGSYNAPTSKYIEESHYYNQFLGYLLYKGNISKQSETSKLGNYDISKPEFLYLNNVSSNYSIGTVVAETETLDYKTRTVITKSVHVSTVNYVAYYNIYAKEEKAIKTKNIVYEGNIYAPTYVYVINIKYINN